MYDYSIHENLIVKARKNGTYGNVDLDSVG